MSAKRTDISQINNYLEGRLDTKAMHQLEAEAQNDPFLMDALDGYEIVEKDQHTNLAELNKRLAERVAEKKDRSILLWRVLPLAACLLLVLGIGYLFLNTHPPKVQYANNVHEAKPVRIQPANPSVIKRADTVFATQSISKPQPLSKGTRKHIEVNDAPPIDTSKLIAAIEPSKQYDRAVMSESVVKDKVQDAPAKKTEQLLEGKIAGLNTQNKTGEPGLRGTAPARDIAAAPVKRPDSATMNKDLAEVVIRGYVKRTREETTGSSYIITGKEQRKLAEHIPTGKIPGKFLPINPLPVSKKQATTGGCNENLIFQDQFFANIAMIEKYTVEKNSGHTLTVTYEQFFNALKFISKHTSVSIKLKKNTVRGYDSLKVFQSDRDQWLKWYEDNKCKGLK